MISFTREDGSHLWLSPMHVTLVAPVSDTVAEVTLVCGTIVQISGEARQIAAMIAADTVTTPDGAAHAVHPLEVD